jgi:potassium efflux system protein
MRSILRLSLFLLAVLFGAAAWAQSPTPTPSPSPTATPVPVSSIVSEADTASTTLGNIQAGLDSDGMSDNVAKVIPVLKKEIDAADAETSGILATSAKLTEIQQQITRWNLLRDNAGFWTGILTEKLGRLDHQTNQVAAMSSLWTNTDAEATAAKVPTDLSNRINSVRQQITETQKAIDAKRTDLLKFQGKLADQTARINKTLAALVSARGAAVDRLFERDSKPLWRAFAKEAAKEQTQEENLGAQFLQVGDFLYRERGKVLLHLTLWAVLLLAFRRARRYVRRWTESDPALKGSMEIFEVPASAATLLALWLAYALYPTAPPLLITLFGAALVLPLFVVLRHLIDRPLLPITWALLALYLGAQAREATAALPIVSRLIFLAEAVCGMIFVFWLIRTSRFAGTPEKGRRLLWNVVGLAARAAFLIFAAIGIANIFGYVNLAVFIGYTALECAFLGILLYAGCHIIDGLITFAFKVPPLSLLDMVRHHQVMLERRIMWVVRVVAAIVWVAFVLDMLSLLQETVTTLQAFFALPLVAQVTVGGLLAFLLTVWASFLISRFVRFLLEEDVYRRVRLKPGIPYAISTLLHYAILLLGFYLAMAALMGDISKFTVLAGAFGVGIGFGLQNIVNNFVSSLIVLFERPIKIGDLIEVGTQQGTVRQIGIRATVIRTSQGSEIIIPNAKLISDPVTNWTLTSHQRLLELEISTAGAGVDPQKVIALLEATATAIPEVSTTPAPEAVLEKFTAAALTFKLRVWTADLPKVRRLRSDLTVALTEALAKNGIAAA